MTPHRTERITWDLDNDPAFPAPDEARSRVRLTVRIRDGAGTLALAYTPGVARGVPGRSRYSPISLDYT